MEIFRYICSKKKEPDSRILSLAGFMTFLIDTHLISIENLPILQKCSSKIGKTISPLASVPYQSER